MQTRIIALANQKGGVGKTTTAVNLAACLARSGLDVLLIDLDPQCNASSGLGVETKEGTSIYGPLLGEGMLAERVRRTSIAKLDLVPSEVDLAGAEIDVARSDRYLHRFSDAVLPFAAEGRYAFIFVDCPPSLGILTMNALAAAEAVIVPTQCEYYALEGLAVICRLIDQIRGSGANPRLEMHGILLTMFDGRTNLSAQVVDEVRRHFGDKVYGTVIPRNVRLSEAPSFGLPVVEYDASSSGAKAYRQFAAEFMRRSATAAAAVPPPVPPPASVAATPPAPAESAGGASSASPQG